jgi:GDP-4-dehydro-6-deoxy-D-mannose reductase
MDALITGSAGFIGSYLCSYLREQGNTVAEADLPRWDVRDTDRMIELLRTHRPQVIYHLAAQSSAGRSWHRPKETWDVNLLGTVSLLESVRIAAPAARVLIVSSASVYDGYSGENAITEQQLASPRSPYGNSKLAVEIAARSYADGYTMDIVIARPFNVIGPRQDPSFVIPTLCRRVVRADREGRKEVEVGNCKIRRDFVDVRDAARALSALVRRGRTNTTYNVCSGNDVSVGAVVRKLGALSGLDPRLVSDTSYTRHNDAPSIIGDPFFTLQEVGWKTQIPLEETLRSILAEWQSRP